MAGPSYSDCIKTSGSSTRQAETLKHEWLGERGQGELEDMMEMGKVKESVEIGRRTRWSLDLGEMYHVSGSRCTHRLTNQRRL